MPGVHSRVDAQVLVEGPIHIRLRAAHASFPIALLSAMSPELPNDMSIVFSSCLDKGEHRLAVLCGLAPDALTTELEMVRPLPDLPKRIDPGTPADLVCRRPDVSASEERAANNDIRTTRRSSATTQNGVHNFRLRHHHHVSKGCWFGPARRTEATGTKPTDRVRDSVDIQQHGMHHISRYAPLALDDLCERGIP